MICAIYRAPSDEAVLKKAQNGPKDSLMTDPSMLPIHDIQEAFHTAFASQKPFIVVAPTGSGKSTVLPQWIARATSGVVWVVEPRRVACRSLATYIAQECGEKLGERIGYRVRGDECASEKTTLLFITPGVALRMLREQRPSAMLIDEFHERNWQTDLLVMLLRRADMQNKPLARWGITSATLEAETLAKALDANLLMAEGRSFSVTLEYESTHLGPSGENLDTRVVDAIDRTLATGERGDILVFLPGKGEINRTGRALGPLARKHNLDIAMVHGSLTPDAIAKAFKPEGPQRVYLSTNVAETSITLPRVRVVIDSGLVRQMIHRGRRNVLALVEASEASMNQRMGRAGRVAHGHCIRLFSDRYTPTPYTSPEVCRIALEDVLLEAMALGLSFDDVAQAPWPTPLPDFALTAARKTLTSFGAITADAHLSSRGIDLAKLTVAAFEARALLNPPPAIAADLADVIALMQRDTDLLVSNNHDDALLGTRSLAFAAARSDVELQLLALRSRDTLRLGIHSAAQNEALLVARDLRRMLGLKDCDPQNSDGLGIADSEALAFHLACAMPDAAFALRPRAESKNAQSSEKGEPWSNGDVEVMITPFTSYNPLKQELQPKAGILLSTTWISGRGANKSQGRGRLLLPCKRSTLAQANVGEKVIQDIVWRNKRVVAHVQQSLGGAVLASDEQELQGQALRNAIAELVMHDQMFKGLREHIEECLHAWHVAIQWHENMPHKMAPPSAHEFLINRLSTLGVEISADVELIEQNDLFLDLEKEIKLMPWESSALLEEFPLFLNHQGGIFRCELENRNVVIYPVSAQAKKLKSINQALLPRFRGAPIYLVRSSVRSKVR